MTDKKKQTEEKKATNAGATELHEEDLEKTQGGFAVEDTKRSGRLSAPRPDYDQETHN